MGNPFSLKGKRIMVTGASSGIGAQTAISISKMGGQLILTGRNEKNLRTTLQSLSGEGHELIIADLCTEVEKLVRICPPIDGMVNCAGVTKFLPIKFIDKKSIQEVFDINYVAPVDLINRLFKAKKINAGSSIVLISSLASKYPFKAGTLYAGAKAGIDAFCKTIALEFAPKKIRANTINAGMVKTPLLKGAEETIGSEEMLLNEKSYPLGFGETSDIAHMAIFLLSDASRWITGTNIVMDGGLTAGT